MNRFLALLQQVFLARRGRPVAAVVLLCLALAGLSGETDLSPAWRGTAAARVLDGVGAPFALARQALFDSYQRFFPRERHTQPVTIVEIDEKSLKAVGQWPWPRNRLADLIDAIAIHKPLAIGLDLYMPEADQTSPDRVAANLPAGNEALVLALSRLPSHEDRLVQSLRAAPTVLGAAGFERETLTTSAGLRATQVQVKGGNPLPYLVHFPWVLASLPELQFAARGQALLSIDPGQTVVRRIPLVMAVNDQVIPSLAMEMLRIATGMPAMDMQVGAHGIDHVGVADVTIATQSHGDVWLHFAKRGGDDLSRHVSAAAVLAGKVPAQAFADKLILLGLTGSGLNDRRNTPLGQLVPGIEIQAQVLESILEGRSLLRPWWMKGAEIALLLFMGGLMIWLIPQTRRPVAATRATKLPRASSWLLLGGCALLLIAGFVLFVVQGWLFDASAPVAGYVAVLVSLVSSSMLETERDNLNMAVTQQHLREQAARVAGELAAARRIQLGSLPDAARAFPGEQRFKLATLLEPAREVGGDLYDFFMIDDHRLCFVVADVSGKGVPASLFMAVTKTLAKSFSLRLAGGPAEVVVAANQDLSRENVGMLFVTLLLGVLDVDTGALELVNAGHDAPWLIHADGRVEKVATPADAGGPPLCVMDDFPYAAQHMQLSAGDALCIITDGVTEAMNRAGELYGGARLNARLALLTAHEPTERIVDLIRDDVARFVGDAEPSDDLTLLLLRWHGPRGSAQPGLTGH